MWVGMPKAAGASSTLSLPLRTQLTVANIITPLPSDHPLQNTEVLQPLLNQTPLSHLTGSCYSEVATGLSALCSSEGGMLFVPKNPGVGPDHRVNTLFISILPKHTNRSSGTRS